MTENTYTSIQTGSTQHVVIDENPNQGFVQKTCEDCGDDYWVLEVLDGVGEDRCHECRDTGLGSLTGVPSRFDDRPLMEYGPLSRQFHG